VAPSDVKMHLNLAETIYHDAERLVRTLLWDLGDASPVGRAPDPLLPLTPRQSWWERLLVGTPGFFTWRRGPDGRPRAGGLANSHPPSFRSRTNSTIFFDGPRPEREFDGRPLHVGWDLGSRYG
jgi:hypothetical protein